MRARFFLARLNFSFFDQFFDRARGFLGPNHKFGRSDDLWSLDLGNQLAPADVVCVRL
jgi:hypothetical protein